MILQSPSSPTAQVPQPAAVAAAPAPAVPAATPAPAAAAASQPVEDAGFAAKLFSRVGESQHRFLANQQLVGEVSAVLGARLSQTLSNVMRLLRGEAAGDVTG